MKSEISPLDRARNAYEPNLPEVLGGGAARLVVEEGPPTSAQRDAEEIARRFPRTYGRPTLRFRTGSGEAATRPLNVGVVLSGGPAAGGHNVIAGLLDGVLAVHEDSELFGFLGGPRGIFTDRSRRLTPEIVASYRNTGGFDLIGSGRDKIETDEQIAASLATCKRLGLDGLVVVGGDDSNTNAAVLAEAFLEAGAGTAVVGVPKTIDGDLKGAEIEASFGFDTACGIFSEVIGSICRDSISAGKYWHFIKLMGRNSSHVTLECALQTRVNIALIGEEVDRDNLTLAEIVEQIAQVIRRRAEAGRPYGVCLVAEGLIEFIPEVRRLITELNALMQEHTGTFSGIHTFEGKREFVTKKLSPEAERCFGGLPARICEQLLLERDAHGNVQVSKIDTEQLLCEQVSARISRWQAAGEFPGKFMVQGHFLGYEGRCLPPSNFDADYTYALGRLAAVLAARGRTGYICGLSDLVRPARDWGVQAIPLTSLMQMEQRHGRPTPVIAKAMVRLDGAPFRAFAEARDRCALEDEFVYPGPIQYFGPAEISDRRTRTLVLEQGGP